MRLVLASLSAAAASIALVGCAVATSAPTASAERSTAPSVAPSPTYGGKPGVCTSKDLTAGYLLGEGAESQDYSVISLRNRGRSTCTLDGWPTVRLLDRAHRTIGPAAGHQVDNVPKLVRLAPGQRAGVTISVASVQVPTAAFCRQQATAAVAISLPGGAALRLPAVIQVCSRQTGLSTGVVNRGVAIRL